MKVLRPYSRIFGVNLTGKRKKAAGLRRITREVSYTFDEYTLEYLRGSKGNPEKREEPDDGKAPREAARPEGGKQEKKEKRKKTR